MHSNQNLTEHISKCNFFKHYLMFHFLCVYIKLQNSYNVVKLICKWHITGLEGRWLRTKKPHTHRTFLPSIEARQNHNTLDAKLCIG